jgi:hypothetical protein
MAPHYTKKAKDEGRKCAEGVKGKREELLAGKDVPL